MTEWNIQARAHTCGACGKVFADKEVFHTLLFDDRAEFRRSDICSACWQKQYSDGARERKGFISYWQTVYEAPVAKPEPIQKETAESLLRKFIELNDPRYIPAAYILAVMLERKRLLKVREELQREGKRVFIYEQPGTGDVFTIVDPNLQLREIENIQREVAALLEHGLHPPQSAEATPAAAGQSSETAGPASSEHAPVAAQKE